MNKKENIPTSIKSEKVLLISLAVIQFINTLNFLIIMPLGPQLIRSFEISTQQFGIIVSAYTFSASIFGIIGAFFLDKFDRKKALLTLLIGFTIGNLLCALAPTYIFLVIARVVAGAFGGVMGATVFAILGDAIPAERRGQATGMVMSGLALATVLGIPVGLTLANFFSWHATFYFLIISAFIIAPVSFKVLPTMTDHLKEKPNINSLREIKDLLSEINHLKAFTLSILLTFGNFLILPYLSPYMISNMGLTEKDLPYIYFAGGFFTLFIAQIIGKLADKYGKRKIFIIMGLISIIPVLIITNLQLVSLFIVFITSSFLMIALTARVVPSTAIITGSMKPQYRGSFMSLNSSVQNMGSGLASVVSGMIISKSPDGHLLNYNYSGFLYIITMLTAIYLSTKLNYEEKSSQTIDLDKPSDWN